MMQSIVILLLAFAATHCFGAPSTTATKPSSRPGGEIIPPPRRDVPGKRIQTNWGELYVPELYDSAKSKSTELVVWFLGAPWCAEQNFFDAKKNAVLLCVSGEQIKRGFDEAERFHVLICDVEKALAAERMSDKPVGKVCLASFSGGYVSIRSILDQAAFKDLITDVVLADSLYARRLNDTKLDPEQLAPFLAYAKSAAKGKCTFWFSHLYPPEEKYRTNTTTLAADYLIDSIGVARKPADTKNSREAKLLYRADQKGFHVLGYAGMTNQDHFDHFYSVSDLFRETSLTDIVTKKP
ncbi:MAG TPA: hypothetical protein VL282_13220 [Tepidisphaeraceae bacterium]|nr:hypothetical protein [Tepidisphaeraceae bacterium]